jgi:uncharacterized protein (TIGR03084 family)
VAAIQELLADLAAEGADLEALVAPLDPAGWRTPTPAPGWTVAHQIAHLAWTDEVAVLSATDPAGWHALIAGAVRSPETFVDGFAQRGAEAEPAELFERWRASRAELAEVLPKLAPDHGIAWFGPPMRPDVMVTARLMETWAHGRDVADALGVEPVATGRLRHIAGLGVRTRNFAYRLRGLPVPEEHFRVELTGPGGEVWAFGPEDAAQRVTGPALDFCLLVAQRRHPDDLGVRVVGPDAEQWLGIAQVFAGPAGEGRRKGQFA